MENKKEEEKIPRVVCHLFIVHTKPPIFDKHFVLKKRVASLQTLHNLPITICPNATPDTRAEHTTCNDQE